MAKELVIDYSDVRLPNGIWLVGVKLCGKFLDATAMLGPAEAMRQLVDQNLDADPVPVDIGGVGQCELVAVVKEPPTVLPGAHGIGALMDVGFKIRVVEPYEPEIPDTIFYDDLPLGTTVLRDVTLRLGKDGSMEVAQIVGPAADVEELLRRCKGKHSFALQIGDQAAIVPRGVSYELHEELDGLGFVRNLSVLGETKFRNTKEIEENEADGGAPDPSSPLFSSEDAQDQAQIWADALNHAYLVRDSAELVALNDRIVNQTLYHLPQLEDELMSMLRAFLRQRSVTRYISKPEAMLLVAALTDVSRLAVTSGVLRYYSEAISTFLEDNDGCTNIASD